MSASIVPLYFDRFLVAELLVAADGRVSMSYEDRWRAAEGAFPVSLSMPLARKEHGPERVHPWIANLLPEESQLAALARAMGVDRHDSLAILREIGGDTAGALSFGAPSLRENWNWEPLADHYRADGEGAALEMHFRDLRHRPFLVGEDGVRLSLAGGQEKTALAVIDAQGNPRLGLPAAGDRIAIPKFGAPSTVIVKPDNPSLDGIVENEAYCLSLAAACGIAAAEADIVAAGGRTALIVARYDRSRSGRGLLRRLHQEDFAQILSVPPGRKYERGTVRGPSMSDLFGVARRLGGADVLAFRDQLIFNMLTANTDAHAKNYSVLVGPQPRMAPLYDVQTVLPWDHVNQYFAQNIGDRKRRPANIALRHWDTIFADAGLGLAQARHRIAELVDAIVRHGHGVAERIAGRPGANRAAVDQVRDMIEGNALRILGRLERDVRAGRVAEGVR